MERELSISTMLAAAFFLGVRYGSRCILELGNALPSLSECVVANEASLFEGTIGQMEFGYCSSQL